MAVGTEKHFLGQDCWGLIPALCHPRNLSFRSEVLRDGHPPVAHPDLSPWRCSEPRFLEEAGQMRSLGCRHQASKLSSQAGGPPGQKKWPLFPLVGQPRDQGSAWQDIDALVCSAVFARGYLPCPAWVEVNQSKVRAPRRLPSWGPCLAFWWQRGSVQAPCSARSSGFQGARLLARSLER